MLGTHGFNFLRKKTKIKNEWIFSPQKTKSKKSDSLAPTQTFKCLVFFHVETVPKLTKLFKEGWNWTKTVGKIDLRICAYKSFPTFPLSTRAWILKCMTSSRVTSSFRYKIWTVRVTAVRLMMQAGNIWSDAAKEKERREKLICQTRSIAWRNKQMKGSER